MTDFKKVDVYAFAMCLYYIYAEKPWINVSTTAEIETKVLKGERPSMDGFKKYNGTKEECIATLIEACWDQEESKRPNFTSIINELMTLTT